MKTITMKEILQFLSDEKIPHTFHGQETQSVNGFSSLGHYRSGTFTWAKKQENWDARSTGSTPVLVFAQSGMEVDSPNCIFSEQSKRAFFETIEHFYGTQEQKPPIGQGAFLSPNVKLGKNVVVGANCTLDGDITVGDDTVIEPNVTILNRVSIGKRCIIQAGCRIGADGFAYTEDAQHNKLMVKHYGGVHIGDDVFLGANCAVDRSQIDDTVIGDGCKFDPLIHIAHNVIFEKNCTVIAGSMIMGSAYMEENSYIASAIIRNQCRIGANAMVGMGAVVVKNVEPGTTVIGNPAKPWTPKEKK